MTSSFTDERDRIEQALTFDTGCEPSAQEIIDALNRAGFQITPGPGYDHSGNDNHLVAGDHGPVITPQAGEWQQECGSIGLQHQCGRCGCEYRSPPPQAGEAEPVAWASAKEFAMLANGNTAMVSARRTLSGDVPLYRTAPPPPACPHLRSSDEGTQWCDLAAVAPVWQPKTPKGWRFTTADFSMLPGRVMFIRDAEEKERWHELPDIDKEREDGPELYVSGSGMTLQEAFAKACAAAERAQPLPPPPDSPGAEEL